MIHLSFFLSKILYVKNIFLNFSHIYSVRKNKQRKGARIMTKTDKLNIMRNRKTVLMARGKENGKIVAKINRKIKKLEK